MVKNAFDKKRKNKNRQLSSAYGNDMRDEIMVLGIDLGTTYSAAAYVDDNGEVQVVVNSEGKRLTPSVFFEETENSIIIGDVAKENAYMQPQNVVRTVKNHMGKKKIFKTSSGKEYTPEFISSYIIRKIVQDAAAYAGVDKIEDVVITVPAYFNDAQRKATEDAARIAGVNMIGSINEPTAAMLSYIHRKDLKEGKCMVYDLGGGTFDVSIVSLDGDLPEVIGKDGVPRTGGHFFDEAIVKYVCDVMAEKYDIDMEDEKYQDEFQGLYLKVDDVKETIEITRELFDSWVKRFYRNTEARMNNAIKAAGITVDQLDTVLMIGGSSRIPFIEKKVAEFTGKQPARDINPDEAVANGAALFGHMIQTNPDKKVFYDTTSQSVGFLYTKKDGTRENIKLIKKNSTLPATYTQDAVIMENYQARIDLSVTEGEQLEEEHIHIAETLSIDLPKGLKKNDPYTIQYTLDEFQLLYIKIEIPSVPSWHFEKKLKSSFNLTEEEVVAMTGIALANTVS